ncbi:MAG: hypothetical protein QW727_04515 [Candidatus Pacearchaeota archaeon]
MVLPLLVAVAGIIGFTALAYFLNLFGIKDKIEGLIGNISNFINMIKGNWPFVVMVIVGLIMMTI